MASPYPALLRARLRSQTAYRTSFALDLLANLGIGLLELAEVYVVFTNVPQLGGLEVRQAMLVFALSNIAFSLADLSCGHLDALPTYLRAGTLDAMLLRPLPVLAQLVTSDVSLKRLGRTVVALCVAAYALPAVDWTPLHVLLALTTVLAGTVVFASLFLCAAALQFWVLDGGEAANAFTYGGSYVAQFPSSVLHVVLRSFFTYVVPAAFVAYLPALELLGLPTPSGVPDWSVWCSPVMALLLAGVSLRWWGAGVRHYTGGGG